MSKKAQFLIDQLKAQLQPQTVKAIAITKEILPARDPKEAEALLSRVFQGERTAFMCQIILELETAFYALDALTLATKTEASALVAAEATVSALSAVIREVTLEILAFKKTAGTGNDTETLAQAGRRLLAYLEPRHVDAASLKGKVH